MPNFVYIAASLDGYIARKDGDISWLNEIPNPEGGDFGFGEFLKKIDAIVMGRNTFEKVLEFGFWPYDLPVFVLSHTLKNLPEEFTHKVEIVEGGPAAVIELLGSRNLHNLYIDGGKTIQSFLEEGLIDDLIITKIPILLGDGIPLFGILPKEQKFTHISTEILISSLVRSWYKKISV